MALRAIVIGTGWAGEGHTKALQAASVDVVAVCGRKREVAQSMAARVGVNNVHLDWRNAISELRPDIVTVATPGGQHREMVEAAAQHGCHIFCEKPMGVDAADARAMLDAVRQAGVKHAYGATSCLEPPFAYVRDLIAQGAIGTLTGIDVQYRLGLSPLLPYGWFHELSQGGGMLNQIFTHALAQVLFVTAGRPLDVVGEARCFVTRAPVAQPIHDFRDWFSPASIHADTEWRPADADTEYSIIMRLLVLPGDLITARFIGSLNAQIQAGGRFEIYGTEGTLAISGSGDEKFVLHRNAARDGWHELKVPPVNEPWWLPSDSNEQHNWKAVFQRFVADIMGQPHGFYPTFIDGCQAAEIIDIVRAANGWTNVPSVSPAERPATGVV